jgi:hypothetical protein
MEEKKRLKTLISALSLVKHSQYLVEPVVEKPP